MKNISNNDAERSAVSKFLKGFERVLDGIENYVTVIMMLVMTIMVIAGVAMRYILKVPNQYGEEISRYAMVIVAFLGISMGVKNHAHLGITGFVDKLPQKVGSVVRLISEIFVTAAFLLFAYQALMFTMRTFEKGQTSASMQMPMWIIYSVMVVGFLFSALRMILRIYDDHAAEQNKIYDSEEEVELNFQ